MLNRQGAPAQVLRAYQAGRLTLVTSESLLAEVLEVLHRPRIARRYNVTEDDAAGLVEALRAGAPVVAVAGDVRLCRDPDDHVVLETAMRGQAEAVVSRDEDLTRAPELAEYLAAAGISLLTVARFLERIRRR